MVGIFYYGYSPFSLVAGAAMDRLGPRKVVPIGAATVGIGALLFATGNSAAASVGRFLQGAGGVFALVGAAYIARRTFPPSRAATLIGATQMFGMAGGSAGQFVVGPMIASGVAWSTFWIGMGIAGLVISVRALSCCLRSKPVEPASDDWLKSAGARARSSCSAIRSRSSAGSSRACSSFPRRSSTWSGACAICRKRAGLEYATAVMRSASVPLGWIIGCPLLGFLSDRIGRRKPVIVVGAVVLLACLAWILYGPADVLPPYVLGTHRRRGVGRGDAAVHRDQGSESAGDERHGHRRRELPELHLQRPARARCSARLPRARQRRGRDDGLEHYQTAFQPLLYGVALAIVLTLFLKETGPAAHRVALCAACRRHMTPQLEPESTNRCSSDAGVSSRCRRPSRIPARTVGAGAVRSRPAERADRADSRRARPRRFRRSRRRAGSTSATRASSTRRTVIAAAAKAVELVREGEGRAADEGQPAHGRAARRGRRARNRSPHGPPHQSRLHHGRADVSQGARSSPTRRSTSRRRSTTRSTSAERDRSRAFARREDAEGRDSRGGRDRQLEDAGDDRRRGTLQDGGSRTDQGWPARRSAGVRQRDQQGGGARSKGSVVRSRRRSRHPARAGSRGRQHAGQAAQLPGERRQRRSRARRARADHPDEPRRQRARRGSPVAPSRCSRRTRGGRH